MQNGAKLPGTPKGIFLKTYSWNFPGILERKFPVVSAVRKKSLQIALRYDAQIYLLLLLLLLQV